MKLCTESLKKASPGLHELAPTAGGSHDAGSCNLRQAFFRDSVECISVIWWLKFAYQYNKHKMPSARHPLSIKCRQLNRPQRGQSKGPIKKVFVAWEEGEDTVMACEFLLHVRQCDKLTILQGGQTGYNTGKCSITYAVLEMSYIYQTAYGILQFPELISVGPSCTM